MFSVELRSEISGNTLSGYAAVFGAYADFGSYLETLAPTAFDAALADPANDVRAYYQHDSSMLLARQSSGTLRLRTDSTGLHFDLHIPDTSYGHDLRELVRRGDLSGMSFGFIAGQEDWGRTPDGRELRTHTSVARLVEVSPVTAPAYSATSVQLRSLADIPLPATDGRTQLIRARARVNLPKGQ
ncbi:HK97 family phage prohead protease [Mycolicibacterium agri]|uniref:HK97 family phage prohead protease n=1 Tax=Mycolicibacterium agri TaxID=36811 RepID=A0A2A7MQ04_MYCAG|nr:HK97 family phage prohead protease [Mycolicibacterium agri]